MTVKCVNNKCVDFDTTAKRNCKRKKEWEGCKKANLYDSEAIYRHREGYHCASGSKAWGDEKYRNWPR